MKYIIESLCLTPRQKQVIRLLLNCPTATNKDIGNAINISERTVKYHVSDIMDKVGIRKRDELVRYYRIFEGVANANSNP